MRLKMNTAHTKKRSRLGESIFNALNRPGIAFGLIGAVLGAKFGNEHLAQLLRSPDHYSAIMDGLGPLGIEVLRGINPVAGAVLAGSVAEAATNVARHISWSPDELLQDRQDHGYVYELPPWPELGGLGLVLGENHKDLEHGSYVPDPEWSVIPTGGLWGNVCVFGGIGSAKTAGVAYPLLRQLFEYKPEDPEKRMGGLVLDVKGDFTSKVKEMAIEYGRSEDILKVRPGGAQVWNPIHAPDLDAEVLAGRLVAVHENMTGGASDSGQWVVDGVMKLFTHSIGLIRMAENYVTMENINWFIQEISADAEMDPTAKDPITIVQEYRRKFEKQIQDGNFEESDKDTFDYHARYFTHEWAREYAKNKATIQGATSNITGLFSKPDIAKTFCPAEGDITFSGFEDVIDSGRIVCLDMPDSQFGVLTSAIGILLKLSFQRVALSRVARAKDDPTTNTKRPLVFLSDEYQYFVTCTSKRSREGDDNFFSLSRQSRAVSIVLTQAPISIESQIGDKKARVVFNSLRSKIFLTMIDPKGREFAAETIGKDWLTRENVGVNETVQGAEYDAITNSVAGKSSTVAESVNYQQQHAHVVEQKKFGDLRAFEGIASIFDGVRQMPPARIYFKADFLPKPFETKYTKRTLPYKLFVEWFESVQQEAE